MKSADLTGYYHKAYNHCTCIFVELSLHSNRDSRGLVQRVGLSKVDSSGMLQTRDCHLRTNKSANNKMQSTEPNKAFSAAYLEGNVQR